MLVLPARRIRSQRRKSNAVFDLHRPPIPFLGTPINFRRNPTFHVPSIKRQIFRYLPQFHTLSNHVAVSIAVSPAPADQREPPAAPDNSKIRFAETVVSTSSSDALAHFRRRFMYLSYDLNQGRVR